MSESNIDYLRAKLTKGDKCILIHIAVTLFMIIILLGVYIAHIAMVKHDGFDMFRITRRNLEQSSTIGAVDLSLEVPDFSTIGVAFINESPARVVCNTILVRHQWSLAPAHCVTIRSDPELSQLLPKWKLKYKDGVYRETDIKRGMVHSYYSKDDFDNNIGLFEHLDHIPIAELNFPVKEVSDLLKSNAVEVAIVGWSDVDEISSSPVRLLQQVLCSQFVSPIVDAQRKAELCVVQTRDDSRIGAHGAALVLNAQIMGFFSWGDRSGRVPQVVLALEPYKIWLESMMSLTL